MNHCKCSDFIPSYNVIPSISESTQRSHWVLLSVQSHKVNSLHECAQSSIFFWKYFRLFQILFKTFFDINKKKRDNDFWINPLWVNGSCCSDVNHSVRVRVKRRRAAWRRWCNTDISDTETGDMQASISFKGLQLCLDLMHWGMENVTIRWYAPHTLWALYCRLIITFSKDLNLTLLGKWSVFTSSVSKWSVFLKLLFLHRKVSVI